MRYSIEDRTAHVALWRESGLSKARYCRESGVPYHALIAWVKDDRGDSGSGPQFVQLEDDRSQAVRAGGELRVDVGDFSLSFSGTADPAWVARILCELSPC